MNTALLLAIGGLTAVGLYLLTSRSLSRIVIGLTLFLLALARRQRTLSGDDLVEDDLEDRRIAAVESTPTEPEDSIAP